MWELDPKEGWAPKNWCFQIVVLEKTVESPLDSMEIKSVNPKGNQSWTFIAKTDAETEAPILWPHDAKSQLTLEKTLGKTEGRRRKGQKRMRWFYGTTDSVDMSLSKLWAILKDREAWQAAVHGVAKSRTCLSINVYFSLVTQSCLTLCNPMNYRTPGLPVHHQLPEFTQTPFPAIKSFQWVNSLHEVAKVLQFQL